MKDMTKGSEFKAILAFAVPMILGQLFQQFYNIADRLIVGRFVGADALGAVGTSFPVMFFTTALIMGIAMGATTVVSQQFGARQHDAVKRTVSTNMLFLGGASLVVSVVGILSAEPLFRLMRLDPDVLPVAVAYLQIIFAGMPFSFLYNAYSALLRGLGDARSPTFFLIVATLLNIGLDLLFVAVFRWGVPGAAFATVLAQAVASILCVVYVYRKVPLLAIGRREWHFDRNLFATSVKLGIPSGIQQTLLSVGFMAIQGLVNSYGKTMTSAITMAGTLESIGTLPVMNIGMALTTFTGQNVGAGRFDRVRKGFRATLLIDLAAYAVTLTVILLFGRTMLGWFLPADIDPETLSLLMEYGLSYINFVVVFIFLMGVMFAGNSLLRGAGDVMVPLFTTIAALSVRVLSAYVMSGIPAIGYRGIWYSIPIGWTISTSIVLWRYFSNRWTTKGVVRAGV
jgi:putative MATE family efflux protein